MNLAAACKVVSVSDHNFHIHLVMKRVDSVKKLNIIISEKLLKYLAVVAPVVEKNLSCRCPHHPKSSAGNCNHYCQRSAGDGGDPGAPK